MVALRLRWIDPACSFPIDNSRRNPADNRGTALAHRLAAIPLLILLVVFNVAVVMRYFVDRPLQSTEEISGLLMIWIVMLGAVAAEQDDQHLHIPLLLDMLPAKVGAGINLVVSLLSAAFLLYVSYVGLLLSMNVHFKVTDINFERLEDAGHSPADFVRRLADLVGIERLMWGSDVGQSTADYAEMRARAEHAAAGLGGTGRRAFLGGNAARLYD